MKRAITLVFCIAVVCLAACAPQADLPVDTPLPSPERGRPEGPLALEDTVAFVSDAPGNFEVFVLSADSDPVRLTESEEDEGFPVWSPDGSMIAFARHQADDTIDLWVMDADGGSQRRICDLGSVFLEGIAWHPDGRTVYLSRGYFDGPGNMGLKIVAVSLDGPESQPGFGVERLWDRHFSYSAPDLTRDGQRIAFSHYEGYAMPFRQDIYVGNLSRDGMSVRRIEQLTEEEGGDVSPSWSPDGSAIAWAHETENNSGNYDVWVMNSDGSEKRQKTSEPGQEVDPIWSSDGQSIIYASDQSGSLQLYMRYAWADEEVLQLTDNEGNNRHPDRKPRP